MTHSFDAPVGDFEWGPVRALQRLRDRLARLPLPELAIALGAALLALGLGLFWLTEPTPIDPPDVSFIAPVHDATSADSPAQQPLAPPAVAPAVLPASQGSYEVGGG